MDAIGPPPGKRGPPTVRLREGQGKRRCTRPHSLDLGTLLSHRSSEEHTAQVQFYAFFHRFAFTRAARLSV